MSVRLIQLVPTELLSLNIIMIYNNSTAVFYWSGHISSGLFCPMVVVTSETVVPLAASDPSSDNVWFGSGMGSPVVVEIDSFSPKIIAAQIFLDSNFLRPKFFWKQTKSAHIDLKQPVATGINPN